MQSWLPGLADGDSPRGDQAACQTPASTRLLPVFAETVPVFAEIKTMGGAGQRG